MSQQNTLFDDEKHVSQQQSPSSKRSTTFSENTRLPVHRWFRYSAGFSGAWATNVIRMQGRDHATSVLDPFAGSATVLLSAQESERIATGFETHKFVKRIGRAKLNWNESPEEFALYAERIASAAEISSLNMMTIPDGLMGKIYDRQTWSRLTALRDILVTQKAPTPGIAELAWLALTAILRSVSYAGTANWQYVLPKKRKKTIAEPISAFRQQVRAMQEDMINRQATVQPTNAVLAHHDAREEYPELENRVGLVLTSPPYPNNFDYADATRLEMTFWGEVKSWGDLHHLVRRHLVTSCSQHASANKLDAMEIIEASHLQPIRSELANRCMQLAQLRVDRAGHKRYDSMVAAYFFDLARSFVALRRMVVDGGLMCFVIGDSAPYGVHIPVDDWLGRLAIAAGFVHYSFEKTRDRNTKWKNRKHRVPLQEGRLWIRG